jgi:hypothetical protein
MLSGVESSLRELSAQSKEPWRCHRREGLGELSKEAFEVIHIVRASRFLESDCSFAKRMNNLRAG